jgi:class 3 adenylate cyclase
MDRVATERVLATVMFTDIVDSTKRAADLGDRRWRAMLDHHDTASNRVVARFGGRIVKQTGDGLLVTFDGPARAVECARVLRDTLGREVPIRAGLHTGEVERRGDDVGGIGVHIAARVAALAGPSEVLVSRTVRDLVVGSDLAFEDRGAHELKGMPEAWQLYAAIE